jgi:tyrosine ammonia-lyase
MLSGATPGLNSGFAGCQLLATSLAADCRLLAQPASIQTIPTNANNQDVVSMGCTAARLARELQDKLWKLLALQALALAQAGDLRPGGAMGTQYQALRDLVRQHSARLDVDRPLADDIAAVRLLLESREAQDRLLPERPAAP